MFIFFTFLSNQIQYQIRAKYEHIIYEQNMNKTQITENQKTMNKRSTENQTKYIYYQGADRVVPLDIRRDCGGSEPIVSERDDGGRGEIEKP